MRFTFKESDAGSVRDKIMAGLGGRELGKMVQLNLVGDQLEVTISKMGTSRLVFDQIKKNGMLEFKLASEKIAFAHRAFQEEVKDKILKLIEQVGGKIEEA